MRLDRLPLIAALAAVLALASTQGTARMSSQPQSQDPAGIGHPYVGMWVTADGRIRHHLLPNGRYDEARGTRESAYQGRYEVRGNEIFYRDDTGFTADGRFVDDVLHHAGMILYRQAGTP